MKSLVFYTIHQAPHNTYTFRCLEDEYILRVFYLRDKLPNYNWEDSEFYYPGENGGGIIKYIQTALRSDFCVISGWQSYKYIVLILILLAFKKRFAIYLDVDLGSLKRYRSLKKLILTLTPVVFVTGLYGEKFLKRYLKKTEVYNFPYGVKTFSKSDVVNSNNGRSNALHNGDSIKVFISNRFIDRKGYHIVRFLLTSLKEKGLLDQFSFIIAGDGPLYEPEHKLISAITPDARFLGWIDYNDYRANMLKTDVYLHCSEYEPYGIPPVDAFNCRKTIVLTNKVYSMFDIIEMGAKVYSFNYNDPQRLVDIFVNLSYNRSELYSAGQFDGLSEKPSYLFENIYMNAMNEIFSRSVKN